jgi:PAS domain S-box-containing protein
MSYKQRIGIPDAESSRRAKGDAVWMALVYAAALVAAFQTDFFEKVYGFVNRYEAWELDELLGALMLVGLLAGLFAFRRWRDLEREVVSRRRVERENLNLAAIVASSDDAIFGLDLLGRIQSWNPGASKIFGYRTEEVIGQPVTILVPPSVATTLDSALQKVHSGGTVHHYEAERVRKGGDRILVSIRLSPIRPGGGDIVGGSVIARDITETRRVEDKVRRLASIVGSTDDAVWSKDPEGRITSWNAGAERLYGYCEREAVGEPVTTIIPASRRGEFEQILAAIRNGDRVERMETEGLRKDNSLVEVALKVSPLLDDNGSVVGASTIARDISDTKRILRELECARNELEQRVRERTQEVRVANEALQLALDESERMNGRLKAEIAERRALEGRILEISEREQRRIGQDLHDGLGQLLTGLACMGKVLVQRLQSEGSAAAKDADLIRALADQALGQTRDLSRGLYPAELERYGLVGALQCMASSAETMLGIECRVETDEPLPSLDDEAAIQLFRIAQEALSNAAKHGGADSVAIGLWETAEGLELTVEDDGTGLPEPPRSTGMGLAIMRYRAESLGAAISVSNRSPRGVRVACAVPLPAAVTVRERV